MLSYTNPLYFPNLVFTGSVHKDTRIYTLDWSKKDQKCLKKHREWNDKYWPKQQLPFMPSLPQEIDTWIINLKFAITSPYRKEINRNAMECLEEWNIKRSFDTNVREYCLKTAEAHAFIAFYLLADCVYDVTKQAYYRGDDKFLIKHALAYKFWAHQTGRGCVRSNARLEEVEIYQNFDYYALSEDNKHYLKQSQMAKEFLTKIDNLEKEWEKMSPIETSETISEAEPIEKEEIKWPENDIIKESDITPFPKKNSEK